MYKMEPRLKNTDWQLFYALEKVVSFSGVARNLAWGVQTDNFSLKA